MVLKPQELTELALRAGSGDLAAYDAICNARHRHTYKLLLRLTGGNEAEAQDLNQKIWGIELKRKIGSFKGLSLFTTWLHRLVVNTFLMHLRAKDQKNLKGHVATESEGFLVILNESMVQRYTPYDEVLAEEALKRLPAGYKTVFLLHEMYGYKHEEIAQILGVTSGTSKSQLHKARARLAETLGIV
ncbi:MAG TPA: RNA polymerase sigma factor [Patescibacteria group bacterium]|nr:RNA polymerase sigma factor [Patescibacteria group bacterium]